jgi:hypothetical protein
MRVTYAKPESKLTTVGVLRQMLVASRIAVGVEE